MIDIEWLIYRAKIAKERGGKERPWQWLIRYRAKNLKKKMEKEWDRMPFLW